MKSTKRRPKYFEVPSVSPCKYKGVLYGKAIRFSNEERRVAFLSEFSPPGYLSYDDLLGVDVAHDPKRWLLALGVATFVFVVGVLIVLAYVHMYKWRLVFEVKGGPPVRARVYFSNAQARLLEGYLQDAGVPVTSRLNPREG